MDFAQHNEVATQPEGNGALRPGPAPARLRCGAFRRRRARGFTLIELMIVISIILILLSFAAPMYQQTIIHAREAVLRQDLFTLRQCIDQFTLDKQRAPQSLDDLVQANYIKTIPKDPFTNSSDTWQVAQEDVLLSVDQTQPGISDVHSGSNLTGSDGTAYSTW